MAKAKAVVDTNVFVSAVLKGHTPPDAVRRAWLAGRFDLCTSPKIIEEISRVFHYKKIQDTYQLTEEEIQAVLRDLQKKAIVTPGKIIPEVIKEDPTDNLFLGCALEANAEYIVSGDRHLRRLRVYQDIQVVTPSVFVTVLEGKD